MASHRRLPRAPVLDWSGLRGERAAGVPSVGDWPHPLLTTSGRAALYQGLLQLRLPAASAVLVPSYHCPTMVAPVLQAGHQPVFFGIGADGLPLLEAIPAADARRARAMIAAHYFGIPRSLAAVRAWCDAHDIALIEDCAHCYFGQAGERPVGGWGDFATASLTKFLPVPEGGLLVSARRPIDTPALAPASVRAQLKGLFDVIDQAVCHGRLWGLRHAVGWLLERKRTRRGTGAGWTTTAPPPQGVDAFLAACDMGRVAQAPLWSSALLWRHLPQRGVVRRRQANHDRYAQGLAALAGARPLFDRRPADAAPYAFALWVDDPEPVFRGLRQRGLPVFRWDRAWPGTPAIDGDCAPAWGHHVLQLLCHQDLEPADVDRVVDAVAALLAGQATAAGGAPA